MYGNSYSQLQNFMDTKFMNWGVTKGGLKTGFTARSGIDTGFFARGGNIFIECAKTDV